MEKFKSVIKSKRLVSFIILLLIVIGSFFVFIQVNDNKENETTFSVSKEIDKYYFSWIEFQKIPSQRLVSEWSNRYFYCIYEMNGNSKDNKYDCFSAIYFMLNDFGANFKLQSTQMLNDELNIISKKRKTYKQVREKDLIIIKIKGVWHIGLVVRILKDNIYYIDVNAKDKGFGYRNRKFNSKTVVGIYPISFKVWIGDFLDKYIEIPKQNLK